MIHCHASPRSAFVTFGTSTIICLPQVLLFIVILDTKYNDLDPASIVVREGRSTLNTEQFSN